MLGMRGSLQVRMIFLAATGLAVAFVLFVGLSLWSVRDGIDRSLDERKVLARVAAERANRLLQETLDSLQSISHPAFDGLVEANVESTRRVLHETYLRTIFRAGVYITNSNGQVRVAEPSDYLADNPVRNPYVEKTLDTGKPLISNVYPSSSGKQIISVFVPIRDQDGKVAAVLGGDIDLGDRRVREIVDQIALGRTGYGQLVDATGVVLAGPAAGFRSDPHENNGLASIVTAGRSGTGTCHECHVTAAGVGRENQVMAYAPVSGSGWAVVIRQSEKEALEPLYRLRQLMLFIGLPLFLISVAVAWATARSVIRPIEMLATSAERIAKGDLSSPIPEAGGDEIGCLAKTLDTMRAHLRELLERVQGWNAELEERVNERTAQLKEQEIVRRDLLHKVICVQEEERRRIARELHDETSQSLAALILALDTASFADDRAIVQQRTAKLKDLAVGILDGVHKLVFDLRPSMLDDLGLEAAIRWYAESRLAEAGVKGSIETAGEGQRLPPEVETTLFRTLQEAISNVVRHANAEHALVRLEIKDTTVIAEVEDDGQGFEPAEVMPEPGKMRGLGLLGIKERIGLLNGRVTIVSRPGHGTHLRFEVPVVRGVINNETDTCAAGR